MQIKYKDIVLRDYRESDIDDEVRWNTVDTAWGDWDAPWEQEEHFHTFDPEAYRQRRLDWLAPRPPRGTSCAGPWRSTRPTGPTSARWRPI